MKDEQLIKQVTEKAQVWLGEGYDADTQAQVRAMLEADDKTDLAKPSTKTLSSALAACAALWELAATA